MKFEEYDVLYGRGLFVQNHPGNVRYRKVVQSRKEQYAMMTTTNDKNAVARQVLQDIKMLYPPSRFLMKKSETSAWELVQDETSILTKIKQALREDPSKNERIRSGKKDNIGTRTKHPSRLGTKGKATSPSNEKKNIGKPSELKGDDKKI